MRKKVLTVLLCISMIFPAFFGASIPVSAANWSIGSNDSSWKAVYPANNQNDYLQDQQTGSGSVSQDIVGDSTHPSTYMHLTDTEAAFRIRVSNVNGTNPYEFKNFAFVGLDADLNGSVDLFLGVYNPTGNNGRLGIYGSSSGYLNTGPSTTGISGKPLLAFKPVSDSNYSITPTGDGSTFNNDPDYFVSFKFALSDITAALAQKGISFNASTKFRFMTGTAAQDNSFNQDLNGMDKSGWSSTKTWNQLGTFSDVTTANGNVAYYTVNFDSNTGEKAASPDFRVVDTGGKALGPLPTEPEKRGMHFQEWNELPDGTGTTITSNTIVDKNMTVYAIWSDKKTFKVTFDPNNGSMGGVLNATVTVSTRDGVVGDRMPLPPTKGTSVFEGWNNLKSGGTASDWFNGTTPVTADKPVFARWTNQANKAASFYNNVNSSGGFLVATMYSNGQSGNFNNGFPTVVRPGYTFVDWYSNKEGTGNPVPQVSEGTYYAKWTPASYNVTFVANAGSDTVTNMPPSRSVSNGQFGTMPAAPVRAGYQFVEWNKTTDPVTGEGISPSTWITTNTSVYAIWQASKTVTFDPNGGTGGTQTITAVNGKLNFLPQPPSFDGKSFEGWATAANSTASVDLQNVSSYSTLYAIWSPVYPVTFNTNKGQWAGEITKTDILTAYGNVLYLPDAPERNNYTFGGWNTQADGKGSSFTLSSSVTQPTEIYAVWTPTPGSQHTVTFDTKGGSPVTSVETSEIETSPVSTQTGYTLDGWYLNSDLNEASKISFPYSVTSNVTLYAKWTALKPITTFNANQGKYSNELSEAQQEQTYGAKYVLPAETPTLAGFTFASWNTQADGEGTTVTKDTTVTSSTDHTIYAKWTKMGNVTLTYTADNPDYGEVNPDSESLNPDIDTAQGSLAQAKPGYTFVEWRDATGASVSKEAKWAPQQVEGGYTNASYTAVFEPITRQVTLDPNGGTGGSDHITATYNQVMPAAEPPSQSGYTFMGYYDDPTVGSLYYDANMNGARNWDKTEAEVTLYAHWKKIGTINYKTNDEQSGTVSRDHESFNSSTDEAVGSTAQANPGYRFVKWQNSEGQLVSEEPTLIPQRVEENYVDETYTAVFEALKSTVTLNDNQGTGGSGSVEATYDQSMPQAKTPVRDRYTFAGYYDQLMGGTQYYNADMSSARNWDKTGSEQILYARWTSERAVTGTVIDDDKPAKLVPTATIRIVRGKTQFGDTTVTDSNGKFTIYNVPAGTYNLIMTIGEKTEIIAITVKENEPVTELGKIIFPLSSASSALKLKTPETPPVVINNLHPEAEQYLMDENNQGFVKVEMSVANVEENTSDTDLKKSIDKIRVQELAKGAYIGLYLDITLDKYKRDTELVDWGPSKGKLKETKGLIEILVPIPANLQGKTGNLYRVYRDHENEPTHTIQATPNADGEYLKLNAEAQTLTLYVKKFSVYALAYLNPAAYSVEHYAMNADGSYPSSPTKTTSGSDISDTVLTVSDLKDPALSASGLTYGYGTVDGATATTAVIKGDGSLVIKLYYARQPQAPAAPPSSPAPAPAPKEPSVVYYDVTFDGAGGTPTSFKQSVVSGSLLAQPAQPARAGYVFDGWNRADGSAWNFGVDRVNGSLTLSAKWTKPEPLALDKVNHFAYMQGYPDRTFRADRNMTRAEVIAMFSRLLTEKMNVERMYPSTFRDVKNSNWYANAVGYMQQAGVVTGYADGTFGPEEPITRAEFAAIASRFDKLDAGDASVFKDVRASYWAGDYIASGTAKGWIKGYPDGTFRPEDYVTRAEAVTLVNRMTERNPDRSYIGGNGSLIEQYKDLKKAYWAYYDIMEAVNRHDYVKGANGETWTAPTTE